MKVTIRSDGHTVEIDTSEDGLSTAALAELAERIWERMVCVESGSAAGVVSVERRQPQARRRYGFGPLEAS